MTRGTGKRWLGDVLAECFVGGGGSGGNTGEREQVPEWVKAYNEEEKVAWPLPDGGSYEDFGLGLGRGKGERDFGFGDDIELMDEETVRILKNVSVPGAGSVDCLAEETAVAV